MPRSTKRKTEKRKPRCWFDDLEDDLKKKRKAKKGKPRRFAPYRSATRSADGSIEIEVKNGMKFIIDEEDLGLVSKYIWHANGSGDRYYVNGSPIVKSPGYRRVSLHRLLTKAPEKVIVDHINGDTLDNRRANLRVCDFSQNIANSRKRQGDSTSRFKGVSLRDKSGLNKPWRLQVRRRGKLTSKYFATEIEAALAYDRQAMKLDGDFAALNFPRELHEYIERLADRAEAQDD